MLHNTRGIVIHTLKFSETSIIAKIYTELFGLQSYLIKGIRSSRSKLKPALFQPLTILDLSVYHKERASLQSIKDAQIGYPYQTLPFEIAKSSLALFMDELIYKTIREEESHPELFHFLRDACMVLDAMEADFQHFHLHFCIRLTRYLGFMPHDNYSATDRYFDMREGNFTSAIPDHVHFLNEAESRLFHQLISAEEDDWGNLPFTKKGRDVILEKILQYYQLHVAGFSGVQSHHILHTVLS